MEDFRIVHRTNSFLYLHSFTMMPWQEFFERHAHNDYELLFIVQGNVKYTIEDFTFPVYAGDLVTIKPMSYHTMNFLGDSPYERFNIALNKFVYDSETINEIFKKNGKISLLAKPFFYQWAQRMDAVLATYSADDKDKAAGILLNELIFWLKYNLDSFKQLSETPNNAVLTNAINYINDHIDTVKGPLDVAQSIFVSEAYLFYLFKKHLNVTPKNYIMQKKMLKAERLIQNGEKFNNVCKKIGYSDYSIFFRTYKKYFGKAPSK